MRGWLQAILIFGIVCLVSFANPAESGAVELSAEPLTINQLQERLQTLVQREGKPTLDLRRVTLDLRDENGEFRDRFYTQLNQRLQKGDQPLTLDLSESVILGAFDFQRLSLREPLYGEAFFPLLTEREQTQLQRDRRRLSQLSQLSRSLLLQPQSPAE